MRVILFFTLWLCGAALADIEEARDLMEAGKFVEAKEALWPAARSRSRRGSGASSAGRSRWLPAAGPRETPARRSPGP